MLSDHILRTLIELKYCTLEISALAEAKDICLYLKPLVKHLTALEGTAEFSEIIPQLKPLLHTVCLIWANSKYYCNSAKIIVLIKQLCNLLIEQVNPLPLQGV